MKLDTRALRYLTPEDWRVLTAVEMGSKNHEVVPTTLIASISGQRSSTGVHKSISTLAKAGLIAKMKNAKYEGYRLTYGGLDYLALHAHRQASALYSIGNQIGVGKESDIYVCAAPPPSAQTLVIKIHRLGRTSFRAVKATRDYLRHRNTGSWMYLSRLAAQREFAVMRALHAASLPVPRPVAHSRHTVVMEFVDAFPLRQIARVPDPAALYGQLMDLIVRLAQHGLIHGDFNEFNILVKEDTPGSAPPTDAQQAEETEPQLHPIVIDFPQTLSIDHPNAADYFARDVACIKRFFSRRFGFVATDAGPSFADARKIVPPTHTGDGERLAGVRRLDVEVEAAGFSRKMARELEAYMGDVGPEEGDDTNVDTSDSDEDADDETEDDGPDLASTENADGAQEQDDRSTGQTGDLNASLADVGVWDLQGLDLQLGSAVESVAKGQRMRSGKAAAGWSI